jgi:hypothetical protein
MRELQKVQQGLQGVAVRQEAHPLLHHKYLFNNNNAKMVNNIGDIRV